MCGIMVAAIAATSIAGCAGTGQLPADTEATVFSLHPGAFRSEGNSIETAPEQTAAAAFAR